MYRDISTPTGGKIFQREEKKEKNAAAARGNLIEKQENTPRRDSRFYMYGMLGLPNKTSRQRRNTSGARGNAR